MRVKKMNKEYTEIMKKIYIFSKNSGIELPLLIDLVKRMNNYGYGWALVDDKLPIFVCENKISSFSDFSIVKKLAEEQSEYIKEQFGCLSFVTEVDDMLIIYVVSEQYIHEG